MPRGCRWEGEEAPPQVLPPTDQDKPPASYCSHDSHSGGGDSFTRAREAVGEGEEGRWPGTPGEEWGEVPQERQRLLALAQKALNDGVTKAVIFVTGDQHWGELLAKRIPASPEGGGERVVYEVTASRVYEAWDPPSVSNGNRLRSPPHPPTKPTPPPSPTHPLTRARSCDWEGEGPYTRACALPFTHQGTTHTACAPDDGGEWCPTQTDAEGHPVPGAPNPSPAQCFKRVKKGAYV